MFHYYYCILLVNSCGLGSHCPEIVAMWYKVEIINLYIMCNFDVKISFIAAPKIYSR